MNRAKLLDMLRARGEDGSPTAEDETQRLRAARSAGETFEEVSEAGMAPERSPQASPAQDGAQRHRRAQRDRGP